MVLSAPAMGMQCLRKLGKRSLPREVIVSIVFMYLRWSLLVSWCFTSIETIRLIRDRKKGCLGGWGWGGGSVEMNSSSTRSHPQRPKRQSATARTTKLRKWGPRQCELTCQLLF